MNVFSSHCAERCNSGDEPMHVLKPKVMAAGVPVQKEQFLPSTDGKHLIAQSHVVSAVWQLASSAFQVAAEGRDCRHSPANYAQCTGPAYAIRGVGSLEVDHHLLMMTGMCTNQPGHLHSCAISIMQPDCEPCLCAKSSVQHCIHCQQLHKIFSMSRYLPDAPKNGSFAEQRGWQCRQVQRTAFLAPVFRLPPSELSQ